MSQWDFSSFSFYKSVLAPELSRRLGGIRNRVKGEAFGSGLESNASICHGHQMPSFTGCVTLGNNLNPSVPGLRNGINDLITKNSITPRSR